MLNNESYDKFNTPEIGDIFIIKKDKSQKKPCKYQSKRYEIKKVSKSERTVYYDDLRTNVKCKCNRCRPQIYHPTLKDKERTIRISEIEIVEKKDQYQRNLKLKILNI